MTFRVRGRDGERADRGALEVPVAHVRPVAPGVGGPPDPAAGRTEEEDRGLRWMPRDRHDRPPRNGPQVSPFERVECGVQLQVALRARVHDPADTPAAPRAPISSTR